MNAYRLAGVLIIGVLIPHAYADEPIQQDRVTVGLLAAAQESAELRAIRLRIAESCQRNTDCASRGVGSVSDSRFVSAHVSRGDSPSTPERRRAAGLDQEPSSRN
jgi:hypothetical protein